MGQLIGWHEAVVRLRQARVAALQAESRRLRAEIRASKAATAANLREIERLKWGDPGPGAA